ncbi:MAG: hypothetical protein EKK41_05130 [Hyphomicrobiales bacterium]|nr:MAG: hypothetical protein EKK41_05130 [Hyphomicrobiales bacterium]
MKRLIDLAILASIGRRRKKMAMVIALGHEELSRAGVRAPMQIIATRVRILIKRGELGLVGAPLLVAALRDLVQELRFVASPCM